MPEATVQEDRQTEPREGDVRAPGKGLMDSIPSDTFSPDRSPECNLSCRLGAVRPHCLPSIRGAGWRGLHATAAASIRSAKTQAARAAIREATQVNCGTTTELPN